MNATPKILAAAALGLTVLGASAASAQGWNDDGYGPGGRQMPSWAAGARDYNNNNGYDGGWRRGPGYGYDTGITDVAVCPPGYHLGRRPGLCWPD